MFIHVHILNWKYTSINTAAFEDISTGVNLLHEDAHICESVASQRLKTLSRQQCSTEPNCYWFVLAWNWMKPEFQSSFKVQFKGWRMLFLTCRPRSRDTASAGCKLPFSPCCRSELVWSRVQSRPAGRRSRPRCTAGLQTGPLEDRDPSIYSETHSSALRDFRSNPAHCLHNQTRMSPTRPWSCWCAPRYRCPCGSCSWRWAAGRTCWPACQETLSQPKTCDHPADAWTC